MIGHAQKMNTEKKLGMEEDITIVSDMSQMYDDDFGLVLLLGKRYWEVIDLMAINFETEQDDPPYDKDKMLHSIWEKIEGNGEV